MSHANEPSVAQALGLKRILEEVTMARVVALEKEQRETEAGEATLDSPSLRASRGDHHLGRIPDGIEALLTSKEASQILKIHPKVLER